MRENINVVVVGGGYAGVMAANRLSQRDNVTVTLVNPRPSFVHRIRLHQLVGGTGDAVVGYREVLADRVRLVVDTATRIDAAERTVSLANESTVGYDYLIYAVGSGSAVPSVPGASEYAHNMASLEEAQQLRAVLDATPTTDVVTVVGGGATGIEVAAELAAEGRTVTLACGKVLHPYLHPRIRRTFAKRLAKLGVTIIDGPGAKVTAVSRDAVLLGDGRELRSTVTVWTAGFSVPDLAARSGLTTDAAGRLLTDETLTSIDDDRIVAAGDSAAPSDMPLRMSCQSANPLGAHAADTVLARIAGGQPATIAIGFFGQCVSLGRGAATVQIASKNDVAKGFAVGGLLGAKIKSSSFPGLIEHLAHEAHKPGSYTWKFRDDTRHQRLQALAAR
ncbi:MULTISPECIES: NAD(P)/FAD-dependent oxidoreductase [Micromonospora]|uniref:NADH dehydrogenase FAD-containing subunit n=1 Tax=Micromonospora vinacea TaxID=709878 RepID=A0ABS0K5T8_9ACTN|nr:FAD-dependent oxidoreductase [Micromonospora vinacea]MBG6103508.1 NADH dehydrogenase FAD-containing subunit [Micromonospora vinacea]WSZ73759.1 FAD-dependent oxidoreductase [Micromonospora sp. NBC_00860]